MNRRRFLQGFIKCAAGIALLPQIEPFIELIPSVHKEVKYLTGKEFGDLMLKYYLKPLNEMLWQKNVFLELLEKKQK